MRGRVQVGLDVMQRPAWRRAMALLGGLAKDKQVQFRAEDLDEETVEAMEQAG